jgi:predicted small lipoprotein YifL
MKLRHLGLLATLVLIGLLNGCGQKGPLYLPDEDKQQQSKK